jgi:hypothetical protein
VGGGLMFLAHVIFAYNVWRMKPDEKRLRAAERGGDRV